MKKLTLFNNKAIEKSGFTLSLHCSGATVNTFWFHSELSNLDLSSVWSFEVLVSRLKAVCIG